MKGWNVDYDGLAAMKGKYSAIILGASIIFHSYDLKIIREYFPDSLILYDASHVMGLILQNEFQKDLSLIDVLYGSTHKNFPGPQGGIILGKKELEDKIKKGSIWRYYDNYHLGRIAALGISLEFLQKFDYAKRCLKNTKAMIKGLTDRGVKIANPPSFTESCMMMIDYQNAASISLELEKNKILIDRIGRIGLNEVTMLGLSERHMDAISSIISSVFNGFKVNNSSAILNILGDIKMP